MNTNSSAVDIGPSRRLLTVTRVISWSLAIGALLAVIFHYGALPNELPVSRWRTSEKTWLLAVRVPLINMLTLLGIEVLGRSLARFEGGSTVFWTAPVLSLTAGTKAAIESAEFLALPQRSQIYLALLIGSITAGIAVALWCSRILLANGNWNKLATTFAERIVLAALAAAYVALNLPLFVQR